MSFKYIVFSAIAVLVIIIDQLTKLYIDRVMDLHSSITVIENFFNITYMRNKGAAFSFLSNFSYRIPFFILVSVVAILVILSVVYRLRQDQKFAVVSLALIFAGALGNLIDRVRLGEVIDFLDVHWYRHHWPAFNVADSAICVGVFLLAVDMYLEERRQKKQGP
ncbi:lipoprotein signal peptidase [Geotalea daltonii FRC-32]|uniref:Lipoprotein signal peptidase n=1 Tax=Geotalea daltonii (strain DSM 22248 / JCM 15807 / FRC-32) TaxID=316067 RepID=B9LZ28_GEODF|nr:signal peptidase II [Geotalea daltonii]ACM18760.1 lipoprotein signal peptidase [Geotalea daltonii FRC-32]